MGEVSKTLLGRKITFSEEMDLFNSLRKKYLELSIDAKKKAEKVYDDALSDYSSYVKKCPEIMDNLFLEYLQIGVLDIIKYGIATISLQDRKPTETMKCILVLRRRKIRRESLNWRRAMQEELPSAAVKKCTMRCASLPI